MFDDLVLHCITTKINRILLQRVVEKVRNRNKCDDNRGCITILMGYVDDDNILVPLEDVASYLEKHKTYGTPLEQFSIKEN